MKKQKKRKPQKVSKPVTKARRRGELFLNIFMLCMIFGGLLVLLYPVYSDSLNTYLNEKKVELSQRKENAARQEQAKKEMEAYNEELKKSQNIAVMDPFEKEGEGASSSKYSEYIIGRVIIPAIKVKIPLYDHTNDALLQEGATVLNGTSFPLGGEGTHSVISAHSGLPNKNFFTDLEDLVEGDIFILQVLGQKLAYEVDQIETVEPDNVSWLKLDPEQDVVTLMTCTPYMINSHRLLVTGHRVPYTPEIEESEKQVDKDIWSRRIILAIVLLLIVIVFTILIRLLLKYNKKKKLLAESAALAEGAAGADASAGDMAGDAQAGASAADIAADAVATGAETADSAAADHGRTAEVLDSADTKAGDDGHDTTDTSDGQ